MPRCPKCRSLVIDLFKDKKGESIGCKWCVPSSPVCKPEYMPRGTYGRFMGGGELCTCGHSLEAHVDRNGRCYICDCKKFMHDRKREIELEKLERE